MAGLTATSAPPLVRLATVDSTQRHAAALARDGAPDGSVVMAETQTAGKGRRGRVWQDTPGAGLLLSLVVRSSLPRERRPTFGLATGIAVVEALTSVGVTARLKWPNDVLVSGRKIAGVLLEAQGDAVIAGIGINVLRDAVPGALAGLATSVAHEGGTADREALLQALLRAFDHWRARLEREGFAPVRARWSELSETLGRRVTVDGVSGVAEALDEDGALLLRTGTETVRVISGDVSAG